MLCSRGDNKDCKHPFKYKTTTLKKAKMGKNAALYLTCPYFISTLNGCSQLLFM